jgi:hypothetical protein
MVNVNNNKQCKNRIELLDLNFLQELENFRTKRLC